MNKEVKGYKVFDALWRCREMKYAVGQEYKMDSKPILCENGFHFCLKASDCFSYYTFTPTNKVAEVIALGDIVASTEDSKHCTNHIKILRELSWTEVLNLVNIGNNCTGYRNTGDYNSGKWNTGYCNFGDYNTGNYNAGNENTGNNNGGNGNSGSFNIGNFNSGFYNVGSYNTERCNTGNKNTGSHNIGNRNTGDWNTGNFNTGCFCTITPTLMLFNKPSNLTHIEWRCSPARVLLEELPINRTEWVSYADMTEQEKKENPGAKTSDGILKVIEDNNLPQQWWDNLCEADKNIIRNIPNFDPDIFKECTGIETRD